jgi:uncharacterized protein (DUF1015 family)
VARVRPFRAVIFSHEDGPDVTRHTAPPYDVVGARERERLLQMEPHNVVALELPQGPLDPATSGNRYETGAATWRRWLGEGVLAEDSGEAVYVLEQRFTLHGQPVRRRFLIAAVDLHQFSEGIVLPHERTLPRVLADRLMLMRAVHANLSQVLGLYSDPAGLTDALLDTTVLGRPLLEATDADAVTSRVWALREPRVIQSVAAALADMRIFIADGHHRYTTALAYQAERRAAEQPDARTGWRPYDSVMMALVNMDDPLLVVLPTHRVATAPHMLDHQAFWNGLTELFEVVGVPGDSAVELLADAAARPTFVVKTQDRPPVAVRLKASVDPAQTIPGDASAAWKRLDVTVLQELVLARLLDIHPDRPDTLERLAFCKDPSDALRLVSHDDVAFLLRPTRVDQLREVAMSGEMMPQKSTYFYPKLLSGLIMRSLDPPA